MFYKKRGFLDKVNATLRSKKNTKITHIWDRFLAIGEENQTKLVCFLESSISFYYQKKRPKTYILLLKKNSNFSFGPIFSHITLFMYLP